LTAANKCVSCGRNCSECEELTGTCLSCESSDYKISFDGRSCSLVDTDCEYPFGPPGSPTDCLDSPYSSDRMIPPYADDATYVDWRDWGVVNEVRDQKSCGSCWAFEAVSNLEINYALKYGTLYELSEQHLVSCDQSNAGCSGGWPTRAY